MKIETRYKRAINKLAEIMQMAMVVNITTDHAVFCELSGHVDWVTLDIRESKANFHEKLVDFGAMAIPKKPTEYGTSSDESTMIYQCEHIVEVHSKMKEWCEENRVDTSGMRTYNVTKHVACI